MSIIVEDMCFCYGEKEVLHRISLRVRTGEKIGISGISGGGKSTLLKLISGLYAPGSGRIEVQGATAPAEIRKNTAAVLQGAPLFPASIRENITCGHPMEEEALRLVCRAAQLSDWIDTLPGGLDTHVGERGANVSGGQAQRIAIARAMAKNAPVVLLDEATSALDGETGRAVQSALAVLTQNKTVVTVSHHPEAFSDCDRVFRLEGGRLYAA